MERPDHKMEIEPKKIRTRSVWRGLLAGIIGKFASSFSILFVCVIGGHMLASATGASESSLSHADDPNTNAWFLLQAINIVSALVAGGAAIRWSTEGSLVAPTVLAGLAFLCVFAVALPPTSSMLRLGIWALGAPVGVLIGAWLYRRYETWA